MKTSKALKLIACGLLTVVMANTAAKANPAMEYAAAIARQQAEEINRRNWEAARQERGFFPQIVRGSTGVSIRDMQRYGWQGGPNSEVRKIGRIFKRLF